MRLKLLSPGEMNEDQKQTYDESIAGKRGAPPAPMMAWLKSPEMARHATRLGAVLRDLAGFALHHHLREHDVVEHGAVREQVEPLEDHPDPARRQTWGRSRARAAAGVNPKH